MRIFLALLFLTANCFGATFGLTADNSGGSYTERTQNHDNLNKFTLSEAGDVTSITAWLYGSAVAWKGVIYADNAGEPGALLGVTNSSSTSTTAKFCTASFATAVSLTAGTYWLGIVANGSIRSYENSGGASNTYCYDNGDSNNYASPVDPCPYRNAYQNGYTMNVYATYTTGGGGTPAVSVPIIPQVIMWQN